MLSVSALLCHQEQHPVDVSRPAVLQANAGQQMAASMKGHGRQANAMAKD